MLLVHLLIFFIFFLLFSLVDSKVTTVLGYNCDTRSSNEDLSVTNTTVEIKKKNNNKIDQLGVTKRVTLTATIEIWT